MANGHGQTAPIEKRLKAVEDLVEHQIEPVRGVLPRNLSALLKRVLNNEHKTDRLHLAIYEGVDGRKSVMSEITALKTELRVYAGLAIVLIPIFVQILLSLLGK